MEWSCVSGDGVFIGGNDLPSSSNQSRTMTASFINETADKELQLDALTTISGGGKKAKSKVGKWIEKTLGDGDGEHEGSDYADDVIKFAGKVVGTIIFKKAIGVHTPPGEAGPRLGVEY